MNRTRGQQATPLHHTSVHVGAEFISARSDATGLGGENKSSLRFTPSEAEEQAGSALQDLQ